MVDSVVWATASGEEIPVTEMTSAHIHNTIQWINNGCSIGKWNEETMSREEWVQVLMAELDRRKGSVNDE